MTKLPELNPVIHGKVRLAIMSILSGADEADFSYFKRRLGVTDGNLSTHLSKLEEAKYIAVKRRFIGKKPNTTYRMTAKGRAAFDSYVASITALLGGGAVEP